MAPTVGTLQHVQDDLKTCQEDCNPRLRDHRPRPPGNQKEPEPTDHKHTNPRTAETTEDGDRKLWSNGMGAAILTTILYIYGNILVIGQLPRDPRVDSWRLLMSSPTPTVLAIFAYIAVVTWLGPRLMRGRQPLKAVKPIMLLYNAFQVVFSTWMFYEAGMAGWFGSYSFLCQPCDFSNSPEALRMVNVAIWYNISKFIDFFDTLFFVLNKKYSHISLLHVSHHALMPLGLWYGVRHEPGGQTTFFGFLNAFVHIVMYTYYLLAAMGPRVRPYLWWKKYLTTFQMIQFILIFVHASLTIVTGCPVGIPLMRVVLVLAVMFLLLFTDFYIKAYRQKAKRQVVSSLSKIPKYLSYLLGEAQKGHQDSGQWMESTTDSINAMIKSSARSRDLIDGEGYYDLRSRLHNS
ncbi:very long chain fatty acid elongase 7-like [Panulirus ornatus]|uniref:very long chain fatty acid elongase 7-like n=1 Tax=Panulirus ornatus TaxID=150431 RepID=UPI003A85FABA